MSGICRYGVPQDCPTNPITGSMCAFNLNNIQTFVPSSLATNLKDNNQYYGRISFYCSAVSPGTLGYCQRMFTETATNPCPTAGRTKCVDTQTNTINKILTACA